MATTVPDSPSRTYLVSVDTLHSSFGNIAQARRALTKFFAREHDAKAQYALMNLSRQIDVIQDSTRDPSLVLSALGSKKFQKQCRRRRVPEHCGLKRSLARHVGGVFAPDL